MGSENGLTQHKGRWRGQAVVPRQRSPLCPLAHSTECLSQSASPKDTLARDVVRQISSRSLAQFDGDWLTLRAVGHFGDLTAMQFDNG
jgi:hypothetical protein